MLHILKFNSPVYLATARRQRNLAEHVGYQLVVSGDLGKGDNTPKILSRSFSFPTSPPLSFYRIWYSNHLFFLTWSLLHVPHIFPAVFHSRRHIPKNLGLVACSSPTPPWSRSSLPTNLSPSFLLIYLLAFLIRWSVSAESICLVTWQVVPSSLSRAGHPSYN